MGTWSSRVETSKTPMLPSLKRSRIKTFIPPIILYTQGYLLSIYNIIGLEKNYSSIIYDPCLLLELLNLSFFFSFNFSKRTTFQSIFAQQVSDCNFSLKIFNLFLFQFLYKKYFILDHHLWEFLNIQNMKSFIHKSCEINLSLSYSL